MVARPARRFIPVFARDDVETSVAIDIGECGGLILAQIDRMFGEGNFVVRMSGCPPAAASRKIGKTAKTAKPRAMVMRAILSPAHLL